MTDPGWDIPGVSRGAADSAGADAPAAAGSSRRAAKAAGRARPSVSASAMAGSSAGAFAGAAASGPSPAGAPDASDAPGGRAAGAAADPLTAATPLTAAASLPAASPGLEAGDPVEALAMLRAGLEYLARADAAGWTAGLQADCLRALAVAESQHAAAHARVLAAFAVPGGGLAGDGHRSPRVWLTWQTRATRRAAAGHVARMRALQAHPRVAAALAAGQVSLSWARQITDWTGRLPGQHHDDADAELLAAAAAGTGLDGLAGIAEELHRQHAGPDPDGDGFDDRAVRLAATLGGAARLDGDLTARCAAAVDAVLDSLAAVRGPEDTRTLAQRRHDALEEACTRLIAADCLPQRAGQPVRLELDITLDQLAAGGAGSAAGPGAGCDAAIQPVVTGHVDHQLLARLADPDYRTRLAAAAATRQAGDQYGPVLEQAVALLSGPAGRAALLRRKLAGPAGAAISLPLDIAGTLDTIPVHLRRAVRKRDKHCRFPGCDLPAAGCDVHHLVHRKDGGRHALANLGLFCRFHHLIAIHRWGWHVTLHPDGTTTATSPDGTKTLHSHPPPDMAA
ncbi:MAG TPA: DUF222 domain-containing protein [Streptosporangiaceae bacterium]|nr:DUF222 domain-containing protein [Streptosporangiaceae bacterium]